MSTNVLGRRLQIDGVILLGQLALLTIGIVPLLRAVERTDEKSSSTAT